MESPAFIVGVVTIAVRRGRKIRTSNALFQFSESWTAGGLLRSQGFSYLLRTRTGGIATV